MLHTVALSMGHDERMLMNAIASMETGRVPLSLGVTLTVGEYLAAVRAELERGRLKRISIAGASIEHDITFVYLKESAFASRMEAFFDDLSSLG